MSLFDKPNNGQSIELDGPDYSGAARFLAITHPGAERFTFQTFDDDKHREDRTLARVGHDDLLSQFFYLWELKDLGAGIYVSPHVFYSRRISENRIP